MLPSMPRGVAWAALALLVAWALPAEAHRRPDAEALVAQGIAIPNLTHGQMAVLAPFAADIRQLADTQTRTDPTFRRLANFAALQRTYCLWGMMPGSVSDEASPFNECAHAYLATLRALLLHMEQMPDNKRSLALVARIERQMILNSASLTLCRFSAEDFNTAQVIMPRWAEIPQHGPSLAAAGGGLALAVAGLGAGFGLMGRGTRRS